MNLVIVESPAKGKTIEKYLGKDYKVLASFGHVRDLPKTKLGVDVEHNYEPQYIVPSKSKKVVSKLKEAIGKADNIYLATDYDREGEAIAYHITQATGLQDQRPPIRQAQGKKIKDQKFNRITFTEITKNAVTHAIKNPRTIDLHLVDAQQARRVLDRLVGYNLSPFLWKKVFKGLSAGRVQSVAVRLIVEREQKIKAFTPEEYWVVGARLEKDKKEFNAYLNQIGDKKIEKLDIKTKKEAQKISKDLKSGKYEVGELSKKEINKWPYPPFTTSTLQQEAAKRFYFSARQTMKLAQDLYEAGKITYMRTDSVNLSQEAINSTRGEIKKNIGKKYLPDEARIYKTKSKGAQEAHEAIRPSHIKIQAKDLSEKFDEKHRKLYDLIRRRMLASQMKPAKLDTISANIKCGKYTLRANGSKIIFDGFLRVWPSKITETELPNLVPKNKLQFIDLISEQHFTKPPARYSVASLVKALEEHGIGRPSTYVPIISTIQYRGYVVMDKGKFVPTESGEIVINLLVDNFPKIVDIEFTAGMEEDLDKIAEDKLTYLAMIKDFYGPFKKNLDAKTKSVNKVKTEEATDKKCPKCKKPMVKKMGKFGRFLACSGFPDCKYTEPIIKKIGMKCPDCKKGDIIERKTRKGKVFWGCSAYPKCKWATWEDPLKEKSQITNNKLQTNSNDQNPKQVQTENNN